MNIPVFQVNIDSVSKMAGLEPVFKDLGWLNGYNNGLPEEYEKCRAQGHKVSGREVGNCAYEYTCNICNITYSIDSSD